MNTTRIMAVAALIVASAVAPHVARAQASGITRTDLQRHDFSVPGREVIQVLAEFAPGVVAPNHSHLVKEIVYVGPNLAKGDFLAKSGGSRATIGRASADTLAGTRKTALRAGGKCAQTTYCEVMSVLQVST